MLMRGSDDSCAADSPQVATPERHSLQRVSKVIAVVVVLLLVAAATALAATSDIDGDGRADRISFVQPTDGTWAMRVTLTADGLSDLLSSGFGFTQPRVVHVSNVDGRRGSELFVDIAHISTFDTVGIYTLRRRHTVRAAALSVGGGDHDYRFGITCLIHGSAHLIVAHAFTRGGPRTWVQRDSTYRWQAGRLHRQSGTRQGRIAGKWPPASQMRVDC